MAISLVELRKNVFSSNGLNASIRQGDDINQQLITAINFTLQLIYRSRIDLLKANIKLTKQTADALYYGADYVELPDRITDFLKQNVRDGESPYLNYRFVDDVNFDPISGFAQYIQHGRKLYFSKTGYSNTVILTYYDNNKISINDGQAQAYTSLVGGIDWLYDSDTSGYSYNAVIDLPADLVSQGATTFFYASYNTNLPSDVKNKYESAFVKSLAEYGSRAGVIVVPQGGRRDNNIPLPTGGIWGNIIQ